MMSGIEPRTTPAISKPDILIVRQESQELIERRLCEHTDHINFSASNDMSNTAPSVLYPFWHEQIFGTDFRGGWSSDSDTGIEFTEDTEFRDRCVTTGMAFA